MRSIDEMEFDLNKEMEVLLRRAREGGSSLSAEPHLDPDMISAFAAGAVPAAARSSYVAHLADCGRCRTILAEVISYPEVLDEIPTRNFAAPGAPWYSRLFNLPRFTYATALLIIVFGGIALVLISQNLKQNLSEVSRNVEPIGPQTSERAPVAVQETPTANVAKPADSQIESVPQTSATSPPMKPVDKTAPARAEETTDSPVAAAAPPPPLSVSSANTLKDESGEEAARNKMARPAPMVAPKSAEAAPDLTETVYGKTFIRKNGVAVDSSYRGQPTVNVKRDSAEFRNLDDALRTIINSISGSLIVMWKGQAYRID